MKKLIAITQRVEYIEHIGEHRDALSQEWTALADACGFIPLLLPNHLFMAQELLAALPVEGVLLTGGNDLLAYGGDAPERDEVERYLIQTAVDKHLPLLGVCRGMQMVLDYFGTPLQRVEGHVRVEHVLGSGDTVNSFHSWGAVECRAPLVPEAWSADGVLRRCAIKVIPGSKGSCGIRSGIARSGHKTLRELKRCFRCENHYTGCRAGQPTGGADKGPAQVHV